MMMTQEVNHEAERELTSQSGHGRGCWEVFAEEMAEKHGIDGQPFDEINGITLWMAYEESLAAGECRRQTGCPGTEYEGEE